MEMRTTGIGDQQLDLQSRDRIVQRPVDDAVDGRFGPGHLQPGLQRCLEPAPVRGPVGGAGLAPGPGPEHHRAHHDQQRGEQHDDQTPRAGRFEMPGDLLVIGVAAHLQLRPSRLGHVPHLRVRDVFRGEKREGLGVGAVSGDRSERGDGVLEGRSGGRHLAGGAGQAHRGQRVHRGRGIVEHRLGEQRTIGQRRSVHQACLGDERFEVDLPVSHGSTQLGDLHQDSIISAGLLSVTGGRRQLGTDERGGAGEQHQPRHRQHRDQAASPRSISISATLRSSIHASHTALRDPPTYNTPMTAPHTVLLAKSNPSEHNVTTPPPGPARRTRPAQDDASYPDDEEPIGPTIPDPPAGTRSRTGRTSERRWRAEAAPTK